MKSTLPMLLILLMPYATAFTQTRTSGLLERSQIEEQYKWNTTDIYENDQAWEKDFQWTEENLSLYDRYNGKLIESSQMLLSCMQLDDTIKNKSKYLWLYAKMNRDVDMKNSVHQEIWSRYGMLESKINVASAFIPPEIIAIPETTIKQFIQEKSELRVYSHYFSSLAKKKSHTLSKDKEDILAKTSTLIDNPYGVFGALVYADIPFPVIKNEKGEDINLNRSLSWRARSSQDRDYRKRGYQEYYKSLGNYKSTLAKNLNNLIDGKIFMADVRNYGNTLEASLDRYHIPVVVYKNLITSVKNNLQPMHRWMAIKKKMLGLDTLYLYDTRVSMFADVEKDYTWEEARDLTYESIALLGNDFIGDIRKAYDNRWIDVYPSPGKETGGYSSGPYGPHAYVKMNWGAKLLDFYTLVHELGHYVHAMKTMQTQPFIYADYPPFLAEVASTTAENISQFYLINHSQSNEEKLYHMEKYMDNAVLFIYNSALMADYEQQIYQLVENGEPLSADKLGDLYGELSALYYGADVKISETDKFVWMEWPHYYLDYYLYTYATSFAAAVQIAENIRNEGDPAIKQFNTFLAAGSSDYPVNVLQKAGVDMTIPEPYEVVAKRMNELMDEMEKMMEDRK